MKKSHLLLTAAVLSGLIVGELLSGVLRCRPGDDHMDTATLYNHDGSVLWTRKVECGSVEITDDARVVVREGGRGARTVYAGSYAVHCPGTGDYHARVNLDSVNLR